MPLAVTTKGSLAHGRTNPRNHVEILWIRRMELASCHPFGANSFDVAFKLPVSFCTPGLTISRYKKPPNWFQKQDVKKSKYLIQVWVFLFVILIKNINTSPATAGTIFSRVVLLMQHHDFHRNVGDTAINTTCLYTTSLRDKPARCVRVSSGMSLLSVHKRYVVHTVTTTTSINAFNNHTGRRKQRYPYSNAITHTEKAK